MRFIGALIALVLAIVLQFRLSYEAHTAPDFALAAILTFSVLLSGAELVGLVLAALVLIAWSPAPSWELVWFALIPFIGLALRSSGFERWAVHLIAVASGIFMFYLFIDPWFITRNVVLFGKLWIMGVLSGVILFRIYWSAFCADAERSYRR